MVEVELLRLSVPLVERHLSATGADETRESVVVVLTGADGTRGLGECPTLAGSGYVTEPTERAWGALVSELVPSLLAGRPTLAVGAPAATASIADACLDLALRCRGEGLAPWLAASAGGAVPAASVEWCSVIADTALGEAELLRRASSALEAGASMVKLKFDDPDRLGSQVTTLREHFDVEVAADANGSLGHDGVERVEGLGLAYLEQPLPVGTRLDELADLVAATATPIALDESLTSLDALADAVAAGALDVASVKPARMGGVVAAANAVGFCAERGLRVFVGGMFELGVGRCSALAVAALSACTDPTDLGPSASYFGRDVVEPVVLDPEGRVSVPSGAGIGRDLDRDALAGLVVDRVVASG